MEERIYGLLSAQKLYKLYSLYYQIISILNKNRNETYFADDELYREYFILSREAHKLADGILKEMEEALEYWFVDHLVYNLFTYYGLHQMDRLYELLVKVIGVDRNEVLSFMAEKYGLKFDPQVRYYDDILEEDASDYLIEESILDGELNETSRDFEPPFYFIDQGVKVEHVVKWLPEKTALLFQKYMPQVLDWIKNEMGVGWGIIQDALYEIKGALKDKGSIDIVKKVFLIDRVKDIQHATGAIFGVYADLDKDVLRKFTEGDVDKKVDYYSPSVQNAFFDYITKGGFEGDWSRGRDNELRGNLNAENINNKLLLTTASNWYKIAQSHWGYVHPKDFYDLYELEYKLSEVKKKGILTDEDYLYYSKLISQLKQLADDMLKEFAYAFGFYIDYHQSAGMDTSWFERKRPGFLETNILLKEALLSEDVKVKVKALNIAKAVTHSLDNLMIGLAIGNNPNIEREDLIGSQGVKGFYNSLSKGDFISKWDKEIEKRANMNWYKKAVTNNSLSNLHLVADLIPPELSALIPGLVAVGGCVRDVLMGNTPKDVDLASPLPPESVINILQNAGIRVVPTGLKHGTVTAMVNGKPYEITTFRVDVNPDGRHTEVEYTTDLLTDLSRRDFTINAMAITGDGELVDPFGGLQDIQNNTLKSVGEPRMRFSEDLLRIIRAARFAARLGFQLEPKTHQEMIDMASDLKAGIQSGRVSIERVVDEFNKAFSSSGQPSVFLKYMWDLGVLQMLIPEMANADELLQNPQYHPEGSVWNHILETVDRASPSYRWHALLHDIGKSLAYEWNEAGYHQYHGHDNIGASVIEEIGRRLKLPMDLVKEIETTTSKHMVGMNIGDEGPSPKLVRRLQYEVGPYLEALKEVMKADAGHRYNASWEEFFKPIEEGVAPILMGRHLIERGMTPGTHFGPILDRAFQHQIETGETDVDVLFNVATEGQDLNLKAV